MEVNQEDIPPWGAYVPRGNGRMLLLIKKLGIAHGHVKKLIGRAWLSLNPRTPVDITYHKMKFRLHPWDNVCETKILFGSRHWEWPELKRIQAVVNNGGVFLDVGANIGYYSIMAARYGADRILAIEPNPVVRSRMVFNVAANHLDNRISILPIALGDRNATATLFIPDGDMGRSTIDATSDGGTTLTVPMKPLALVLAEAKIDHIDAMKIDVEGMEDSVLFPFYELSPRSIWPRLVIIEHTRRGQCNSNIINWMTQAGYEIIAQTRSNAVLRLM